MPISNLKHLEELEILEVRFSDGVLAPLKQSRTLRRLSLHFDPLLTRLSIESLGQMPDVQCLELEDVFITPAGASQLGGMTKLTDLKLDGGLVEDHTLELISSVRKLEALRLKYTNVTPLGLVHLNTLPNLKFLSLDNPIDSQLVSALKQLPSLRELSLSPHNNIYATQSDLQWMQQQLPNIRISIEAGPFGGGGGGG